jgi:hypothetical protein
MRAAGTLAGGNDVRSEPSGEVGRGGGGTGAMPMPAEGAGLLSQPQKPATTNSPRMSCQLERLVDIPLHRRPENMAHLLAIFCNTCAAWLGTAPEKLRP